MENANASVNANTKTLCLVPEYDILMDHLLAAYERCAYGKGKERHADDKLFELQPIITEGTAFKTITPHLYQIRKKALELTRFATLDAKLNELSDIIVYACAARIILIELERETCEK